MRPSILQAIKSNIKATPQEGAAQAVAQPVTAPVAPIEELGTQVEPMRSPFMSEEKRERLPSGSWMDDAIDDPLSLEVDPVKLEAVRGKLDDASLAERLDFFANPSSNPKWVQDFNDDSREYSKSKNAVITEAHRRHVEQTGEQIDAQTFWDKYRGQYETTTPDKKAKLAQRIQESGLEDKEQVGNFRSMWNSIQKTAASTATIPHAMAQTWAQATEWGSDGMAAIGDALGISEEAISSMKETHAGLMSMVQRAITDPANTYAPIEIKGNTIAGVRGKIAEDSNRINQTVADLPTKEVVASIKDGDVIGTFAAGFSGLTGFIPSIAVGATTGGAGLVPWMMGDAMNSAATNKRDLTDKEYKQIFADGGHDPIMSMTIGATSGMLEKWGLKGVSKGIKKAMADGGFTKKLIEMGSESGVQSLVELAQAGIEQAGTSYSQLQVEHPDWTEDQLLANAVVAGKDFIFSKEGLETVLSTAMGSMYMFGGSAGVSKLHKTLVDDKEQRIANAIDDPNVPEESKEILRKQFQRDKMERIKAYQESRELFKQLPESEQAELVALGRERDNVMASLEKEGLTDEVREYLTGIVAETDERIDQIKAPFVEQLRQQDLNVLKSAGIYSAPIQQGKVAADQKKKVIDPAQQRANAMVIDRIVEKGIKEGKTADLIAAEIELQGRFIGDGNSLTTKGYVEMLMAEAVPTLQEVFAPVIQKSRAEVAMEQFGVSLEQAEGLKASLPEWHGKWMKNRQKDAPSATVELIDDQGAMMSMPVAVLNQIFSSSQQSAPESVPAIDAYIKSKKSTAPPTGAQATTAPVIEETEKDKAMMKAADDALAAEREAEVDPFGGTQSNKQTQAESTKPTEKEAVSESELNKKEAAEEVKEVVAPAAKKKGKVKAIPAEKKPVAKKAPKKEAAKAKAKPEQKKVETPDPAPAPIVMTAPVVPTVETIVKQSAPKQKREKKEPAPAGPVATPVEQVVQMEAATPTALPIVEQVNEILSESTSIPDAKQKAGPLESGRDLSQVRHSILAIIDRAMLAGGSWLRDMDLKSVGANGRMRYFFQSPQSYILMNAVDGYAKGKPGYSFMGKLLTRDQAAQIVMNIQDQFDGLEEQAGFKFEGERIHKLNQADVYRIVTEAFDGFEALWKMKDPESYEIFEKYVTAVRGIQSIKPSFSMAGPNEWNDIGLKRLVTGLFNADGLMLDPETVTQTLQRIAASVPKKGGGREFIKLLRKTAKEGKGDEKVIAERLLSRVGALVDLSMENVVNTKELTSIFNTLANMRTDEVVASVIGPDGLITRQVMNVAINAAEMSNNMVNSIVSEMDAAKAATAFQRVLLKYKNISDRVTAHIKAGQPLTPEQDAAYARELLNEYYNRVVDPFMGRKKPSGDFIGEIIDKLRETQSTAPVWARAAGMIQTLASSKTQARVAAGDFKSVIEDSRSFYKALAEVYIQNEPRATTWVNANGDRVTAQGPKTHIDGVADTINTPMAEGATTPAQRMLKLPSWKNNPVLKLWDAIKEVGSQTWTEGSFRGQFGLELSQMGSVGILADNIMAFAKGKKGVYSHMYKLNGDRDRRKVFNAPMLTIDELADYFGVTKDKQFDPSAPVIQEYVRRANDAIRLGRVKADADGLARVNQTYPVQFKLEDGAFVADGVATKAHRLNAVNKLVQILTELNNHKVIYNGQHMGYVDAVQEEARKNPSIAGLVALHLPPQTRMTNLAALFEGNDTVNEMAMADIFVGDLIDLRAGGKAIKDSKTQTTGGMNVADVVKDFYIVEIAETPGTDSGSMMNANMSEAASMGVINGLGPNMKIGFTGVVRHGKEAGHGINWKMATMNAVRGKNGKNVMAYDSPGSDHYARMARLMDRLEDQLRSAGDPNPRIIFMPPSSQKVSPYKLLTIDMSGDTDALELTDAHFKKVSPETMTVNFNINKDMSDGATSKRQLVQMLSIIQEVTEGMPVEQKQNWLNEFHGLMAGVMEEQMREAFGPNGKVQDADALARQLIEQVFGNDMTFSSKAALDHLKKLYESDDINHHIEDENLYGTALGKLTQTFNRVAFTMQLDGGVLQTYPELNTDPATKLKWEGEATPEVVTNPAMGAIGDLVILARVPSSGSESMFVGRIVGHIPADVNSVMPPAAFLKYSNSDHDGDMLHAFTSKQSTPAKQAFINFMMSDKAMLSETFLRKRDNELNTKRIEDALTMAGIPKEPVSLNSVAGRMNVLDRMNGSTKAIGIFANAKKIFTNLHALGMSVAESSETMVLIDGQLVPATRYGNKNFTMMGELLQAALDKFDGLLLSRMGIDMSNINEVTMLANLETANGKQMSYGDIITLLRTPEMKAYGDAVKALVGPFEGKDTAWPSDKTNIIDTLISESVTKQNNLDQNLLKLIRAAVVEGNNLSRVSSMTAMDKGIPYGMGEVMVINDKYEALKQGGDGYLQMFNTALGKHYKKALDEFTSVMGRTTLAYNSKFRNVATNMWAKLGLSERQARHWDKLNTVTTKLLNGTVTKQKYDSPTEFINSFGKFLVGLKNGNDEMYPIGKTSEQGVSERYQLQELEADAMNAEEQLRVHMADMKSSGMSNADVEQAIGVITQYRNAKMMLDELTNNLFIRNLSVFEEKDGTVKVGLSKKARGMNGQDKANLVAAFEALPQEFADRLHDYVLLGTGSKITPASIWSLISNSSAQRYDNASDLMVFRDAQGNETTGRTAENMSEFQEALMLESLDMVRTVRPKANQRFEDIFLWTEKQKLEFMLPRAVQRLASFFPISADRIVQNAGGLYLLNNPSIKNRRMVNGKETYEIVPFVKIANNQVGGSDYRYFVLVQESGSLNAKDGSVFTGKSEQMYLEVTNGINELQRSGVQGFSMAGDTRTSLNASEVTESMREKFKSRFRNREADNEEQVREETGNQMGTRNAPLSSTRTIASDPKLYNKIVKRLRKTFPNVQVMDWQEYQDKYGAAPGIGQARQRTHMDGVERVVAWSMSEGNLDTPPHEYAHQYVWMFESSPIVQKGLELYGSMEALVEAVGHGYVRNIEGGAVRRVYNRAVHGVQSLVDRMAEREGYAKAFWAYMKQVFGSADVAQILADNMITGKNLDGGPMLSDAVADQRIGRRVLRSNADQFMDSDVMPGRHVRGDADLAAGEQQIRDAFYNATKGLLATDVEKDNFRDNRNDPNAYLFQVVAVPATNSEDSWTTNKLVSMLTGLFNTQIEKDEKSLLKNRVLAGTDGTDPLFLAPSVKEDFMRLIGPQFNRTGQQDAFVRGLVAKLYNPNDPLTDATMGQNNGLSYFEVLEVTQAYNQLGRVMAMLEYQRTASKEINVATGEVVDTKLTVDDIVADIDSRAGTIKSTLVSDTEGSKVSKALKGLYQAYIDKFDRFDSKVMAITGDENSPLYQVFVQAFKVASNRYNMAFSGTESNPGAAITWENVINKIEGFSDIIFDNDGQFSIDKVKDVTQVEVTSSTIDAQGNRVDTNVLLPMTVGERLWVAMMAKHIDPKTGVDFRSVLKSGGMGFSKSRATGAAENATYQLTEAQIQAIERDVAGYQGGVLQSDVMPGVRSVFDQMLPFIEQTYSELTGLDFESDPNYFPVSIFGQAGDISRESGKRTAGEWDRVISSIGVTGPGVTIRAQDIFGMMQTYIHEAAEFHAYAIPTRNAGKLAAAESTDGQTIQAALSKVGADAFYDDLVQHMKAVVNESESLGFAKMYKPSGEIKPFYKWSRWAQTRLMTNALAQNATVMLTQLLGGPMAAHRIPWKYIMAESIRIDHTIASIAEAINMKKLISIDSVFNYADSTMPELAEMRKHSADLALKFRTRLIDSSQATSMTANIGGKEDKILGVLSPSMLMAGITFMDLQNYRQIWRAAKRWTADEHPQLAYDSPEYWEHVAAVAEDASRETQASFEKVNRSMAQMNPGSNLYSFLQRFSSQSVAMVAQMKKSHYRAKHFPTNENKWANRKVIASTMLIGSTGYAAIRMAKELSMVMISQLLNGTGSLGIDDENDLSPLQAFFWEIMLRSIEAFALLYPILDVPTRFGIGTLRNYGHKGDLLESAKESLPGNKKSVYPILDAPNGAFKGLYLLNDGDMKGATVAGLDAAGLATGLPGSYIRDYKLWEKRSEPQEWSE